MSLASFPRSFLFYFILCQEAFVCPKGRNSVSQVKLRNSLLEEAGCISAGCSEITARAKTEADKLKEL